MIPFEAWKALIEGIDATNNRLDVLIVLVVIVILRQGNKR